MIYKRLNFWYVFFVTNSSSSPFESTDRTNLSVWTSAGVYFTKKEKTTKAYAEFILKFGFS
jgi:hypothetical protein